MTRVNDPIKILFDENFGKPLVLALARFLDWYDEPVEITHLFQFANASEKDEVWIPRISAGGWLLITADKGKRCGGRKLPEVCRDHGVSHVLLSTAIHKAKQFEKARAIVAVWPRIVQAARWTRGTRYSLRYEGADKRVNLVESLERRPGHVAGPLVGFDGKPRKRRPATKRKSTSEIPEFERLFKNNHGRAQRGTNDIAKPTDGV